MAFSTDNIGKDCYINMSEDENIEDSLYGTIIGYYKDADKNEEYYFVSINGNVKRIYDDSLVNIVEDGSGSVTPGSLIAVSEQMTEEQASQFRENVGAVSIDEIGTVFTLKGGVATVGDLPASGNNVGDVYYVEAVSAGYIWMTSETQPNGYWEELGETIDLSAYELKPTQEYPVGSTATITPANNTIYNCGELTSLTISNPPATGAYSIVFTSGSTSTTTTIPATVLGLEDFAAEANTIYEINVLDNRAVVGSWAVSV